MTTWNDLFLPVVQAKNTDVRLGQQLLGDAVIQAMDSDYTLLAEAGTGTGKSLTALIPLINKVRNQKPSLRYRGVISTETTVLQDQYIRDLEWLHDLYGKSFTYSALKGRSNYLCFNAAENNSLGNKTLIRIVKTLRSRQASLGTGERKGIEKLVGTLSQEEWDMISGSYIGCNEYKCESEDCFSALAREVALASNIVVTNHAMLQVDADSRSDCAAGILGDFTYLFVDEAHTLESVLMSGWTESISEWEINHTGGTLLTGVQAALTYDPTSSTLDRKVASAMEGLSDYITSATRFFGELVHRNTEWNNVEDSIRLHSVFCADDSEREVMNTFEIDGIKRLDDASLAVESAKVLLDRVSKDAEDYGVTSRSLKEIRKAITACKTLSHLLSLIRKAMDSEIGTVVDYGVPYAVVLDGFTRKSGDRSCNIQAVPLDVSTLASNIWKGRKCVLMSATLRDNKRSYAYLVASLGIGACKEITVDAPFDYNTVQKVYVTDASRPIVPDVFGARYSFDEMVELVHAAKGRTLVLFTARAELEDAAHRLNGLIADGKFPYTLLVQTSESSKARLAEEFEQNTDSVLLGLKSFFTGNNFAGETLSQVIIVKYPLPRYNTVCKQQIAWWRGRGFPDWYEREASTVFRQASGRLIRSSSCRGVVSLLDQRVAQQGQNVHKTALAAVQGLGSSVIRTVGEVREFLS